MPATVTSLGSVEGRGPWLEQGQDGPEWADVIRYQVAGVATRLAAVQAVESASKGTGSAHPGGIDCVGVGVKPAGDGVDNGERVFLVDTTYRKQPANAVSSSTPSTSRPPLLRFRFGFVEEPTEVDGAVGVNLPNPIVNSAGDPFDPPITTSRVVMYITEKKWMTGWTPATALPYIDAVNDASLTLLGMGTIGARTLRCVNFAPDVDFYAATTPLPVLVEWEYRYWTFDRILLDQGYRAWWSPSGSPTRRGKLLIKGSARVPPAAPVYLDGLGTPLNEDEFVIDDPVWSKTGSSFTDRAASLLPSYIGTPSRIGATGGYALPYRLLKVSSLTQFATWGF